MRTRKKLLTKRNPRKVTNATIKRYLELQKDNKYNELFAKQSEQTVQDQN